VERSQNGGGPQFDPEWAHFLMKKTLLLIAVWILLVYYPNPLMLTGSIGRMIDPVQPGSVDDFAAILPEDPAEIERLTENYILVEDDWDQHGVFWYVPTAQEVVINARGNCKHRTVLLANVFEAKGIEYEYRVDPVHFWLDYDRKHIGEFEQNWESGKVPPADYWATSYRQMLWDDMPTYRKVLLIVGTIEIALIGMLLRKIKNKKS
jgi:hypothetical protein